MNSELSSIFNKEIFQTSTLKQCEACFTISTPQWRRGPNGPKTMCNACGVKYYKRQQITSATYSNPSFIPKRPFTFYVKNLNQPKIIHRHSNLSLQTNISAIEDYQHQIMAIEKCRAPNLLYDDSNLENLSIAEIHPHCDFKENVPSITPFEVAENHKITKCKKKIQKNPGYTLRELIKLDLKKNDDTDETELENIIQDTFIHSVKRLKR